MKVYKLCKIKDNKLFPLYVNTHEELKLHEWLIAKEGEKKEGKVKSKLGLLAYRPGFHASSLPCAKHIGKKSPIGLLQKKDTVWVECEVLDLIDYTPLAKAIGNGVARKSQLDFIAQGGYYKYKTNTNADDNITWIISGELKINKILTNTEVKRICLDNGIVPQITEEEYYGKCN